MICNLGDPMSLRHPVYIIHLSIYLSIYLHTQKYTYIYMYMCVHICVCVRISMYAYVCIFEFLRVCTCNFVSTFSFWECWSADLPEKQGKIAALMRRNSENTSNDQIMATLRAEHSSLSSQMSGLLRKRALFLYKRPIFAKETCFCKRGLRIRPHYRSYSILAHAL